MPEKPEKWVGISKAVIAGVLQILRSARVDGDTLAEFLGRNIPIHSTTVAKIRQCFGEKEILKRDCGLVEIVCDRGWLIRVGNFKGATTSCCHCSGRGS